MKHIAIGLALVFAVPLSGCVTAPGASTVENVQLGVDKTLASAQTMYVVAVDIVVMLPAGPTKDALKAKGATIATALHTAYRVRSAVAVGAALSETSAFLSSANSAKGTAQ